jgi:hypothetical protein
MHIAMVTETYPPEVNGVARTVGRMVDGMRQRGHSVQVARPRQNGHDATGMDELLQRGFPIPRYPQLMIGAPAGGALQRAWSERRPDIVHIVTEGPLGWSALAAARKSGLKVSTGFHTNFHHYSSHYGVGFLARPVTAYLRYFHNRAAARWCRPARWQRTCAAAAIAACASSVAASSGRCSRRSAARARCGPPGAPTTTRWW